VLCKQNANQVIHLFLIDFKMLMRSVFKMCFKIGYFWFVVNLKIFPLQRYFLLICSSNHFALLFSSPVECLIYQVSSYCLHTHLTTHDQFSLLYWFDISVSLICYLTEEAHFCAKSSEITSSYFPGTTSLVSGQPPDRKMK